MNTFSTNSSYKIIRISDNKDIQLTFDTYYNWEKKEFDIIELYDDNDIFNIILNNNEIDAIVIQFDDQREFENINKLPEYYKRKIYYYDTKENYGIDLALKINKDQLSHYSTPLFSIVTPLYKTKFEYFKCAYNSLNSQTLNDWEWIIVDDSPKELNYVKGFIELMEDPRVKYFRINPTNGNIGLAKWRGNCMTSGKWLFELDHDDFIYSWTLQTIKEAIDKYPNNKFIYSDNTTVDENSNITECAFGKDYEWGLGYGHSYMSKTPSGDYIRTDSSGPVTNATIRYIVGVPNHFRCWERKFYFAIGGHNQYERICDDYELLIRSFLFTKFTHIKLCCYAQRFDNNNSQFGKDNNNGDIQRRTRLAAIYYHNAIHNRLEQVGLDDSKWIKDDPYITAHTYKDLHLNNGYNDIYEDEYIPEWAKE